MTLVEFNWKPTDRQLRQFGIVSTFALPLVGWFWSAPSKTVGILALVGLVVGAVGWIRPQLLKPIFISLAVVATPIGMVVSELMMVLIYGFVFVPMGLWFRVLGRDAMNRKTEPKNSYWESVKKNPSVAHYYRQS